MRHVNQDHTDRISRFNGLCLLQENKLEALVVEEWRGATVDGGNIICDVIGGICPWTVINGIEPRDWTINASTAALMVNSFRFSGNMTNVRKQLFPASQMHQSSLVISLQISFFSLRF